MSSWTKATRSRLGLYRASKIRENAAVEIRTRTEAADIVEPDDAQVAGNLIFRVEDRRHQMSRRFGR
jgi:hypothetical protein